MCVCIFFFFFLCHQLSRSENQNTHLLSVGLVRINQTSQTRYNVITFCGQTVAEYNIIQPQRCIIRPATMPSKHFWCVIRKDRNPITFNAATFAAVYIHNVLLCVVRDIHACTQCVGIYIYAIHQYNLPADTLRGERVGILASE